MLRAFIAIQLSDEVKRQIGSVQAELKREVSGSGRRGKAVKIGWTQPEGIHLTLKFLGDIQETQVEALREILKRAASPARPFTLEARGLGAFPNPRAPRVIWLGLHGKSDDMAELQRLQAAVEDGVAGPRVPQGGPALSALLDPAHLFEPRGGVRPGCVRH